MQVDIRMEVVNHAHGSLQLQVKVEPRPLCPSTVILHQYDGTTLPTKSEIEVVVTQGITGKFVIDDISNDQLPIATWGRLVAQVET